MTTEQTLQEMVDVADEQVEDIGASIGSIDDQIADLTEKYNAIEAEVTDVCEANLVDRLTNVKLPYFQGTNPGAYLEYDAGFGDIGYGNTLTGWRIKVAAPPPIPPAPPDPDIILYEYEGVGWDSDPYIIQWVEDWDFSNDYMTKPLGTGGTYGISPMISSLNMGKTLLESNQTKIQDSKSVFSRYIG
jgi:hypothetical protein